MSRSLRAIFGSVRADLFPRWVAGRHWRVRTGSRSVVSREGGHCDSGSRTIHVNAGPTDREVVVVHEICHAVAGSGHGARWQRRMARAAERARTLGRTTLAMQIEREVSGYIDAPPPRAAYVYDQVSNAAWAGRAAYHAVLKWVASSYGFTLPELESRYPRLRATFDRSRAAGVAYRSRRIATSANSLKG
jgi:hypothetical protein